MGMLRVEITTVCMLGWGLQKDKKMRFGTNLAISEKLPISDYKYTVC